MIICKAKEEDLKAITQLEKELFSSDPWNEDAFRPDLENDIADLMVLKDEEEVIGYYDIWYMFENADIVSIAIKKEYQGRKLGELLLKDLIKRCIRKNVEFIHLEVKTTNEVAYNLYKKYDFIEVRRREKYYSDGTQAIDMVKGIAGLSEKDFSD